ncbi:hypothetical protein STW0522RAO56_18110 [Raoultella planticola]|nr:hypothetical protein STW0522RAO56_18110 [Raoultella planticola]
MFSHQRCWRINCLNNTYSALASPVNFALLFFIVNYCYIFSFVFSHVLSPRHADVFVGQMLKMKRNTTYCYL